MKKSLIIQSDNTIMLQTSDPSFNKVKDELIKFSEIKQSPDTLYIYEITALSIWNAIAIGIKKESILKTLNENSIYPIPQSVVDYINTWYKSYGVVTLESHDSKHFFLRVTSVTLKEKLKENAVITRLIYEEIEDGFLIRDNHRGEIKSTLMRNNVSVHDKIGYSTGDNLEFKMRDKHLTKGFDIEVRYYQEDSSKAVFEAGNGVVVLPCGSGKTTVGIRFAELCQATTLIVTNSSNSVKQWKQALLDFTTLTESQISCYDADNKVFAPVTICTYNMLAYRYKKEFIHFNRFIKENWGVLILDEVHLMPANMFRIVASFQATKRLALTATFVREDKREKDIFTLIGPKRYDKPWKDLEAQGFIARVTLKEMRVPLTKEDKQRYLESKTYQEKLSIAVMSPNKLKAVKQLLAKHKNEKILIIGQFTDQLEMIAEQLNLPVLHGKNSSKEREYLYNKMRNGELNELVASSIANAALDIPGISVVIQVSFQGGSRNEEAQRVGRCTRPKDKPAYFYTLVSKDTQEEAQNFNRQQFLTSEGYNYEIQEMAIAA